MRKMDEYENEQALKMRKDAGIHPEYYSLKHL